MGYRLYAIRVFTRDWPTAVGFYRDKLELDETFSDPDLGWAQFDVGGPSLAVERVDDDDPEQLVGRFAGVSLQVDDIDQTYQSLIEKGVNFISVPKRQPWGGVLAHFEDPDRNVLTLLGT